MIDETLAKRVIFTPYETHPWNHFSTTTVSYLIDFFDRTLGTPSTSKDNDSQIWPLKTLFNALGLIGLAIFIVSFSKYLLSFTYFSPLKTKETVTMLPKPSKREYAWFWLSSFTLVGLSYWGYVTMYGWSSSIQPSWLLQSPVFFIGIWSAFMGLMTIIMLGISSLFFPKFDIIKARGLVLKRALWIPTLLFSLYVVIAVFMLVFLADYLFQTDFRLWLIAFKAFEADKISYALSFLPLFLLFYIPNSIAINVFNHFKMTRFKAVNIAVLSLFNGLSMLVLVILNYMIFFSTGEQSLIGGVSILGIWAIPMVIILPLAAILSRKLYLATNNPYLAGFISALIVAMISSSNTLTTLN
ncbi:hypothetical protein L0B53_02265 [Vibrio sp. SS-MA-C1-2]|uniref:hypothetical protein n=1 Tax=Vibrio sp. SS-MA-C1-2 TaxID=2908646 RepID=UPI001F42CC16|nr:hypothetical protein [Vibrio sp. SS-MA-C1-2]UJF17615.1 hypothetical protein L0B53_02265 [Vibrio sp. SS-MA-C1-2]